jgi:hypothetical protein
LAKTPPSTDAVIKEFRSRVNMTRAELQRWLATDHSREVGFRRPGQTESVGHASGRRIVELLGKGRDTFYPPEEVAHMRKVIGYIKRHTAQRPEGDVSETRWRASLRNWGHDPLKA